MADLQALQVDKARSSPSDAHAHPFSPTQAIHDAGLFVAPQCEEVELMQGAAYDPNASLLEKDGVAQEMRSIKEMRANQAARERRKKVRKNKKKRMVR